MLVQPDLNGLFIKLPLKRALNFIKKLV